MKILYTLLATLLISIGFSLLYVFIAYIRKLAIYSDFNDPVYVTFKHYLRAESKGILSWFTAFLVIGSFLAGALRYLN